VRSAALGSHGNAHYAFRNREIPENSGQGYVREQGKKDDYAPLNCSLHFFVHINIHVQVA